MKGDRLEMIKSLKKIFIPELRKLQFKGSFPHFRRTIEGKTNLLTFQFDRDGGGFIIEIGNYSGTEFTTPWGSNIPLSKLTAHDLNERHRIYPTSTSENNGKESWFRYDRKPFFSFGNTYDTLANKVLKRLTTMEEIWKKHSDE